jgi:erythromycin esterase-like protein
LKKYVPILLLLWSTALQGSVQLEHLIGRPDFTVDDLSLAGRHERLNKYFRGVLQNNDVLILAESAHGHGRSLDAQAVILKELLDSSAISSIYLEANWMTCDKINSTLRKKGVTARSEVEQFINSYELLYWKKTGFWDYLAGKIAAGKVELKGFDITNPSPDIVNQLYKEALTLKTIVSIDPDAIKQAKSVFGNGFAGWQEGSLFYDTYYQKLKRFIDKVSSEYERIGDFYRAKQWASILDFFYWMVKRSYPLRNNKAVNQIEDNLQLTSFHAIRDSLMAVKFLEQMTEETGKVACSMSAYHALRNSNLIPGFGDCCKKAAIKTMGETIAATSAFKLFSVCFIAAEGHYGVLSNASHQPFALPKPKPGSLEYLLSKQNETFSYYEMNERWAQTSFEMNVLFNEYRKSTWANNYSGIFFINSMTPLKLYSEQ